MADTTTETPKKKRAPAKPRKVYVAYRGEGDLEVVLATRKAEELLNLATSDRTVKYTSIEV